MSKDLSAPDPSDRPAFIAWAAARQATYAAWRRKLADEFDAAMRQKQDQQFSEAQR